MPGLLGRFALFGGLLLGLGRCGLAGLGILVLLQVSLFGFANLLQLLLEFLELGDLALQFLLAALLQLVYQFLDVLLGRLLVRSGGGRLVLADLPGGALHLAGRVAVRGVLGRLFQGLGHRGVALLELLGRFADLVNGFLKVASQFALAG